MPTLRYLSACTKKRPSRRKQRAKTRSGTNGPKARKCRRPACAVGAA